jgi:integrase
MRSRDQEGHVQERGKNRDRFYGLFYHYERMETGQEVRRHIGVALGEKPKMRKFEARAKLRKIIAAFTAVEKQLRESFVAQGLNAAQQAELRGKVQGIIDSEDDSEIGAERAIAFLGGWVQPAADHQTLEWFVRERFLPMKKAGWATSTRETNLYIIEQHILPALGAVPLGRLDKFKGQTFLNDLLSKAQRSKAKKPRTDEATKNGFSASVIKHCRFTLTAILEEALDEELIKKNFGWKLETPKTEEPEKFVLPKDQARALLEALPFRDRLLAMIAAFCAMRPGEIFGLQWSSFRSDRLLVKGTAWRGVLRPGQAKTKGSKAEVALPDVLIPALETWRQYCGNPPAEALIFPSEQKTPLRPENWLRRNIKPIAAKLKITVPVNFQVLRRTFATNAEGGNMKDVQTHLRHANIATTANVYMQPVLPSVRALVNSVTNDVMTAEPPAEPAAIEEPAPLTRRIQ